MDCLVISLACCNHSFIVYFVLIHAGKQLTNLYISILSCFSLEDFQLASVRYLTRPDLATSL